MITLDGLLIRKARRMRHWTQDQLAEASGCARNSISRAEAGYCSQRLAERIARSLGVDFKTFYTDHDKTPTEPGIKLSGEEWRVVEVMRKSPRAADAIWNFALGVEASLRASSQ